jgi:hypothetical protein
MNHEITSHSGSLIEKDREPSIFSHRKIGNRELGTQNIALQNSDTQYCKILRRLVSHPSQRTCSSRSESLYIGISKFAVLKDRRKKTSKLAKLRYAI